MNFMTLLGIVESIQMKTINDYISIVNLKIDNVLCQNRLNQLEYQVVPVKVNKKIFKNEIGLLKPGTIIGIKGRIDCDNQKIDLIAERIKIFN